MRHLVCLLLVVWAAPPLLAAANEGYYRYPAIAGDVVVFTAEGDLWRVSAEGGVARRLTTRHDPDRHATLSPDGTRVAFTSHYAIWVMDVAGGLPERLTWSGWPVRPIAWTPDGAILYSTTLYSTLPDTQLVTIHPETYERRRIPLSQAAEGIYDPSGETLFFTRFQRQDSSTKRYRGGTAENLWRFHEGDDEAVPLTADFAGTSHQPMYFDGRVYFVSDRDGTMNLYSMAPDGSDVTQHTFHEGWDVKHPDEGDGRIVYQLGADLHVFDAASGEDKKLEIRLSSDFDQMAERWVDSPMSYLTAAHLSPDGDRVVLTARGQVFVAPVGGGRFIRVTRDEHRYRAGHFLAGGEELVAFSDASGEVELWRLDPRGLEEAEQLTDDGETLRIDLYPSPDGRRVAYVDKDDELWVFDLETGRQTQVATSLLYEFFGIDWSSDGRWLAFATPAANQLSQVHLYDAEEGAAVTLTSERFHSFSPAFSPDGRFLYFLSDRNLRSTSRHSWGRYLPLPHLANTTKVYFFALQADEFSPFAPVYDELAGVGDGESEDGESEDGGAPAIDLEGLRGRLYEAPVKPGQYSDLTANDSALFWLATEASPDKTVSLQALPVRSGAKVANGVSGLRSYELSADGEKMLVRKGRGLHVIDAAPSAIGDLGGQVSLDGWTLRVDPRREWRQLFVDAWRLQRDFFYDPQMHGVDWEAVREKYLPLVERVRDRDELSDLFGEMIGELSALHEFVYGGDRRRDEDVPVGYLGALLERDPEAGGYRIAKLYRNDPDLPEERGPLARPRVGAGEGDVLVAIDGVDLLSVSDPARLLHRKVGQPILVHLKDAGSGTVRQVMVEPIDIDREWDLRHDHWDLERRERVEEAGGGEIGYVRMRGMGNYDYGDWARYYFPVYKRKGLVIDLRHATGGNIDSWLLGNLLRRPWMWWKGRNGLPFRNMPFAFDGHMVVLCDEYTLSDAEAFAEGFRRLGLGKVFGTRTWGGEVWLTRDNGLIDRGIATAAEFGVYGPEGGWLIEGHGVDPDVVVDNLPHATWKGGDAQLEAAVEYLLEKIAEDPPTIPEPPPYPDKSFKKATPPGG